MRSRLSLVLCLAGCRGLLGFEEPVVGDDARPGDAPAADADVRPPVDASLCSGTFATVCLTALPTEDRELEGVLDTDTSPLCVTTQQPINACVVAGRNVVVENGSTLRAVGSRPLVLVASEGAIQISGTLDVASRATGPGAGANPASCSPPENPSGRSGAAGGTFGGRGGGGGQGLSGQPGFASPPLATLATLRGGCAGGRGNGTTPGLGGPGGGAVWLIGPSITVAGRINASGAGGRGGAMNDSSAGGGGSGGAIVLDAATIAISGQVFANGGGGGEGGGNTTTGMPGADPVSATDAAAGGAGGSVTGGDGGAGSLDDDGVVGGTTMDGGGGGGGGGAGFVLASPNRNVSGAVSPAPRDL